MSRFDQIGRIPESSYRFASEDEKIDRMVSCPPNCLAKRVVSCKIDDIIRGTIYLSGYVILSMWAA
jgi:hypothetical protein